MSWSCEQCTFENEGGALACTVCGHTSRAGLVSKSSAESADEWPCLRCTFINKAADRSCALCEASQGEEEGDADKRDNPKRKRIASLVDPSDSDDGKAVRSDSDVKKLAVGQGTGYSQEGKSLLASLHAEREARRRQLGSSGAGSSEQATASQDSLAARTGGLVDRPGAEAAEGSLLSEFVILSYNVWFNEEVQVQKRMDAIGDIIAAKKPQAVCLQELTPNILSLFMRKPWWHMYRAIPAPSSHMPPYFAMLLVHSSLPAKLRSEPLPETVMGRDLLWGELELPGGVALTVANTHLESPCPGPPTYNLFSKERVTQANSVFGAFKSKRNVVWGGDMNWDDKRDGQAPLPPGWCDAWQALQHTADPGWTYDAKANQMLLGYLRGRLDRFVCRLSDFEPVSIELLGTEPIPGVTYSKETRGKNPRTQVLPVLPSDHYGLLLKLRSIKRPLKMLCHRG